MKILFITNYYPPSKNGWGTMHICEQIADGLTDRGHDIAVLTSTFCDGVEVKRPYPVYRHLTLEPDWGRGASAPRQFFIGRRQREMQTVTHLVDLVEHFQPDIAFVWHVIGIPRVVLQTTERLMKGHVAYYFTDYQSEIDDEYQQYWQGEPIKPLAKLFKKPLASVALNMLAAEGKPIPLRYNHAACVSAYVRDRLVKQGIVSPETAVIYSGIDLSQFDNSLRKRNVAEDKVRCLVTSQLAAQKGIDTVIDAFGILDTDLRRQVHLTILGSGETDYVQKLHNQVAAFDLDNVVTFQESLPYDEMPRTLAEHDILIFPSESAEPLAQVILEGMAMKLLVIGTTTGGSGELLVHEQTGLVYDTGRPTALAAQLACALSDRQLFIKLAEKGYQTVHARFGIERTVAQCEAFLTGLV